MFNRGRGYCPLRLKHNTRYGDNHKPHFLSLFPAIKGGTRMFSLFCLSVILLVIHLRYGLSVVALSLAMFFGAVVGAFLGPAGAISATVLLALLTAGKDDADP